MPDLRMPELNAITIAARIAREPELRHTADNMAVCSFTCVYSKYKGMVDGKRKERLVWMRWTAFGKQAEFVHEKFKRGDAVILQGQLDQDDYEDKAGNSQQRTKFLLDRIHNLAWPEKDKADVPVEPKPKPIAKPVADYDDGEIPF